VNQADVLDLFRACSDRGRWGEHDSLGTLNFITEGTRIAAAALVTAGRTVSLAQPLSAIPSITNTSPVGHEMLEVGERADITCMDSVTIACHGVAITHLDALGHMFFEGRMYNGRHVQDQVTAAGLGFADVMPLSAGIFTRGVLLDVARARGVAWLDVGDGVTASDLRDAEALSGTTVRTGDAIFVHTGAERRERAIGASSPGRRTGLTPDCLPWLFEHEVAVYSGDCTELIPSGFDRVPYPLHQVGFVAFGLVLLDNPRLGELVSTCEELDRDVFAVTCAALPLRGATGCPVNPLAIF
jgi:kynurenine formamidase